MAVLHKIMLVSALLMLAACRSDPIQFHTLSPTLTPTLKPSAGGGRIDTVEVQIEAISLPPQVDRQQVVIRQSDSSLAVLEGHWWGASLVDEMRSALAQQLPSNGAARSISVRLDVQRLDSIPGQYALMDVKWRLRDLSADGGPMVHCRSTLKTAAGLAIDDVVLAHQQNLQRLATEISQAASTKNGRCSAGT